MRSATCKMIILGGGKLALNFKILGQNVRGLNEKEKRTSIFNFTKSKADIVFLQETHSTKLTEKKWEDEWGGKCIYSHRHQEAA